EVTAFDDDLARLVERMVHLMVEANGIGLAATQVGVLRRVFVFRRAQDDDEEAEGIEALALVNPHIVEKGAEVDTDDEGCLSLQGVRVPVERSNEIILGGLDPQGSELRLELEGVEARVVLHELDHLDGVLIVDRTTPEARRDAMAVLRPQL